jgi:hypothetical protein
LAASRNAHLEDGSCPKAGPPPPPLLERIKAICISCRFAAAAKMPGHFETVVFYPVPADPDPQAKPAIREQVDIRGLFGEQRSLSLRQDDHARDQFELLGDAGEVSVGDQRLVERIGFFIRAGQFRFSAGMNGAEDMIVDHNMVVTQVFRLLPNALTALVSPPSSTCG